MSDVVVSTTKSVTSVSTTDNVTEISITETPVEVSSSTAGLQGPPGANSDPTYVFVTNKTGAQLNKGSIVYVSGANGTHTQVSLALATGDVTSARTLGWLAEDIANNATGLCMVEGYLDGVNTQGVTEGAQLYLSPTTPGAFTETKPSAPDHMVYVGFCSKASAGNGRVFVFVQNGAELEELHDVKIVSPQNNDLLRYVAGTALWENVASTAVTVGSAISAGTSSYAVSAGTSVYANSAATAITSGTASYSVLSGTAVTISGSITKSQVSDFTSGTVTSASTAQQAGTAVYSVSAGTSDYSVLSGTAVGLSGSIVRSQVSDFSSGTVASAGTAQQAGTAVFATSAGTSITSGTADYSVLSGTAVTISGTITNSQVSDFASGTVANISGTVTQSQVANLTTDLAGKANLAGGNSFTGAQIVASSGTAIIPLVVRGTAGQSADLLQVQNSGGTAVGGFTSAAAFFVNNQTTIANSLIVQRQGSTHFRVDPFNNTFVVGTLTVGQNTTPGSIQLGVYSGGTATVPVVVRGASGQSVVLQSWQDSNGTVLASIGTAGQIRTSASIRNISMDAVVAMLSLQASATTTPVAILRGAASQSASLQEWQNSSGGTVTRITASGSLLFPNSSTSINGDTGNAVIQANSASAVHLVVRGAASQSADLLQIQNSSSGTAVRITSTYALSLNTASSLAQLTVVPASTATVGVVVQGLSGQSANLQEWQSTGGTILGSVSSIGALTTASYATINSYATLTEENAGGRLRLTKATAVASSPGANLAKIYLRDGTNAGTLKLVVRAGAAGAETTILDNIPT